MVLWMRVTPKACCMAATVPVSLVVQHSMGGVLGAMARPNSLAKARTSLTAAGSAPCCWRYCDRVRRCLPVRLAALRGVLRLTMTETVNFVAKGAGLSPAASRKEARPLPGSTVRGETERWGVGFFFVAMV